RGSGPGHRAGRLVGLTIAAASSRRARGGVAAGDPVNVDSRESTMLHRRLGFLVLLCAGAAMVALGVLGVGHGGLADTNLDMRFLYLAGTRWWHGVSAYVPRALESNDPWLRDAAASYDFAYPPQSAPLCLLLAAWSPTGARVLMTALNVAAAL